MRISLLTSIYILCNIAPILFDICVNWIKFQINLDNMSGVFDSDGWDSTNIQTSSQKLKQSLDADSSVFSESFSSEQSKCSKLDQFNSQEGASDSMKQSDSLPAGVSFNYPRHHLV